MGPNTERANAFLDRVEFQLAKGNVEEAEKLLIKVENAINAPQGESSTITQADRDRATAVRKMVDDAEAAPETADEVESVLNALYPEEVQPVAAPEAAEEEIVPEAPTEAVEEEVAPEAIPEVEAPISALAAEEARVAAEEVEVIPKDILEREAVEQRLVEEEPIYALEAEEIATVNADIERLGSVQDVAERYPSDTPQDRYARQRAERLYPEAAAPILSQRGTPYQSERAAQRKADDMGPEFGVVPVEGGFGVQEVPAEVAPVVAKETGTAAPITAEPTGEAAVEPAVEPTAEAGIPQPEIILAGPEGKTPFKTMNAAKTYAKRKGEGYEPIPYGDKFAVRRTPPAEPTARELTDEERVQAEKELDRFERERKPLTVKRRPESSGFTVEGPEGEALQFSPASIRPDEGISGIGALKAEQALEGIRNKLNIPIRVVGSVEDLTGAEKRAVEKEHRNGNVVSGFYNPNKDDPTKGPEIVILGDTVASQDELVRLILSHELAHYGIEGVLGKKAYKGFQKDVANDRYIGPLIRRLMRENGWSQERAAGEFFAQRAEGYTFDKLEPNVWQRIVALFRKWARVALGVKRVRFTHAEMDELLRKSFEFAQDMDVQPAVAPEGDVAFRQMSADEMLKQLEQVNQTIAELPAERHGKSTDAIKQRLMDKAEQLEQQIANRGGLQFRSKKAEGAAEERKMDVATRSDDTGALEDLRKGAVDYAKKYIPGSGISREQAKQHLTEIYNANNNNDLQHAFIKLEMAVMGEEDGLGTDSEGNVTRTKFELAPETKRERVRRWLQDHMARLQTVQKEIVKQTGEGIPAELDTNMKQVLEIGRDAYRIEKFMDSMVRGKDSFVGRLDAIGIHYHDFAQYLTALHTPERRQVTISRKIAKARSEKQKAFWTTRLEDENDEFGSGMSSRRSRYGLRYSSGGSNGWCGSKMPQKHNHGAWLPAWVSIKRTVRLAHQVVWCSASGMLV